jgi:hypothetical protein
VPKQYPGELRERAVRLVAEHRSEYETEYAAIRSIAVVDPEHPRHRRAGKRDRQENAPARPHQRAFRPDRPGPRHAAIDPRLSTSVSGGWSADPAADLPRRKVARQLVIGRSTVAHAAASEVPPKCYAIPPYPSGNRGLYWYSLPPLTRRLLCSAPRAP